ncbi:MAG: hypothetical protein IID41_08150 [Planctomycetes bacterium]|nr:hypothetical protein [Planctomycetota bacterium]
MRKHIDVANCDLCDACTSDGADVLAVSVRFDDYEYGSAHRRFLEYSFNHKVSLPEDRRRAVTCFIDNSAAGGESTNSGLVVLDVCFGCLTSRALFIVMKYSRTTNQEDEPDDS